MDNHQVNPLPHHLPLIIPVTIDGNFAIQKKSGEAQNEGFTTFFTCEMES